MVEGFAAAILGSETKAEGCVMYGLRGFGDATVGASSSSTVIGGFDLSSIPTWGWLAAAGVAAFFMFGKGGR
jgi:hypothetical protein